jgi:hypothetical protein
VAETKKLQEQSLSFSAELAEFLNSEYPNKSFTKYDSDSNFKLSEEKNNTNQVDSIYFETPIQQSENRV